MKLSEIMRGYQSLNSVQTLFKSQSSFMYENLIEDIFSLNNQHPSKAPLQHFYPRDGWMISLIISNEISQPLVSPSHPGSYWSSVASLPDTVLWLVNTSTHQLPVLSLAAGLRTLTGRDFRWDKMSPTVRQPGAAWPFIIWGCSVAQWLIMRRWWDLVIVLNYHSPGQDLISCQHRDNFSSPQCLGLTTMSVSCELTSVQSLLIWGWQWWSDSPLFSRTRRIFNL